MRRLAVLAFTLVAVMFTTGLSPAATRALYAVAAIPANYSLKLYATEAAAKSHFPSNTVVWLNLNSGIDHEKSMRWYGRTKQCGIRLPQGSRPAGDRDTRNGQ